MSDTALYTDIALKELTRACPRIHLSRPTPLDNTELYLFHEDRVAEPAKSVLCFDCQKPVAPGMGVQVRRHLKTPTRYDGDSVFQAGVPCDAIVHADCNKHHENFSGDWS